MECSLDINQSKCSVASLSTQVILFGLARGKNYAEYFPRQGLTSKLLSNNQMLAVTDMWVED